MWDSGVAALMFIASLRDRTGRGESVTWRLETLADLDLDPDLLCHLVPPAGCTDPGVRARWHRVHRFGLLYYRSAPGFVAIYDSRPVTGAGEILLAKPEEAQLFERLSRPGPLPCDDPAARRLRDAKLLAELDGIAVALPYRESQIAPP